MHTPLELPPDGSRPGCDHIPASFPHRRVFCSMIGDLDDAIGRIVNELHTQGMLDNTLFIFSNDNGGHVAQGSRNYPVSPSRFDLGFALEGECVPSFLASSPCLLRHLYDGEALCIVRMLHGVRALLLANFSLSSSCTQSRGEKSTCFEGGVKGTGFIASFGDDIIPPSVRNTDCGAMVNVADWLPTIIGGVLGLDPSKEVKQPLDG